MESTRSVMMEEGMCRRNTKSRAVLSRTTAGQYCMYLALCLLCAAVFGLVLLLLRRGCPQSPAPDSKSEVHVDGTSSALRHSQKDEYQSALLTAPFGNKTNGKYLLWESKKGNAYCHGGILYSNGNLVLPSKGVYRVFLQITYESNGDFTCEGFVKLVNKVFLYRVTYTKDVPLLASVDTVSCSTNQWSKSLHTSGIFDLEANSTLRVTSEHVNLISSKEYLVFFGAELI
ncbi:lymphotoxin-alpha-like isoform X2 [Corythoichthys intestinalis]|nr:lymphotoxin-alpha-like isoform X2 [Corythoichthys intestinalis]